MIVAERSFARSLDNNLNAKQLQSLADRICRSAWFRKLNLPFTSIQVFLTKNNSDCIPAVSHGLMTVNLNQTLDANAVGLLHCIAHRMTPTTVAAHGPEYCKNMMECVRRWISPEAKKKLLIHYREQKAKTKVYSPEARARLKETAGARLRESRAQWAAADLADLLNELDSSSN